MMAQRLNLALISPYDPFTEPSWLSQRGKAWRHCFQTYLLAMNITDSTQQRALLLYQVGEHTQDIFDTIPNNGQTADYIKAMSKPDKYFLPKRNVTYGISQFCQAAQQPGESVDQYATRLRKLPEYCEFADINAKIRSTISQHCSSLQIRQYALCGDQLTLYNLLTKARALEASESQARGMETTLHSMNTFQHKPERANFIRNRMNPAVTGPSQNQRHFINSAANNCGNC